MFDRKKSGSKKGGAPGKEKKIFSELEVGLVGGRPLQKKKVRTKKSAEKGRVHENGRTGVFKFQETLASDRSNP